jgi:hypothetical protein
VNGVTESRGNFVAAARRLHRMLPTVAAMQRLLWRPAPMTAPNIVNLLHDFSKGDRYLARRARAIGATSARMKSPRSLN